MIFFDAKSISVNPENYFSENDFEGSQLININYDRSKNSFIVVIRFARTLEFINWVQTGDKTDFPKSDFRLLMFETVEDVRIEGQWIKFTGGKIDYNLRDSAPLLVDYFELENSQKIMLSFTSSTKVSFCFKGLLVQQRFGRAFKVKDRDEWSYSDYTSGENFDFFNPFDIAAH